MNPGSRPGRRLPDDPADLTSTKINDDTKVLVVELLKLVRSRFGTVVEMIRFAMAAADQPEWAVGTPRHLPHERAAKSAVSKFLGSAADRAPDWATTAWIVRNTGADERLARIAGLWCAATGQQWPPGHTGPVDRGDRGETRLTDPDDAPDDATRAEMYRRRCLEAESANAHLRAQLAAMTLCAAKATRQLLDHDHVVRQKDITADLAHKSMARANEQVEGLNRQLAGQQATHLARSAAHHERQQQVIHHLAVLLAHALTAPYTDRNVAWQARLVRQGLLPVTGRELDVELCRLLDIPDMTVRSPISQWLAIYLRTVLVLTYGPRVEDVEHAFRGGSPEEGRDAREIAAVVATGRLPSPRVLQVVVDRHPMLQAYAPAFLRCAHLEQAGKPVALAPDRRPPLRQRIDDGRTIQARVPTPRTTPHRNGAPRRPRRALRTSEFTQVTVADLIARERGDTSDN